MKIVSINCIYKHNKEVVQKYGCTQKKKYGCAFIPLEIDKKDYLDDLILMLGDYVHLAYNAIFIGSSLGLFKYILFSE